MGAEKGFEAKDRRRSPLAMRVREGIRAGNEASDHLNKAKKMCVSIRRRKKSCHKQKLEWALDNFLAEDVMKDLGENEKGNKKGC
jgi:hypothetical protein